MLVLLRHGESEGNAEGRLLGRLDSPLTEIGLAQARALGRDLGPVRRLVSSPLSRARDTAGALGLEVAIEVDERWTELDYGSYDGMKLREVPEEMWRRFLGDESFSPPGGESLAHLGSRVRAACGELFGDPRSGARSQAGDVVVVSHVSPIKAAVAWALDAPDPAVWHMQLSTGSLTEIGWGRRGPVLVRFNHVPVRGPESVDDEPVDDGAADGEHMPGLAR